MLKHIISVVCLLALARATDASTNALPNKPQTLTPVHSRPSASPSLQRDKPREGVKPGWDVFPQPGSFIMSLARDGASNVWVGTEEHGVWRYGGGNEEGRRQNEEALNKKSEIRSQKSEFSGAGEWTQFTTKDGLGDDYAYAVAVDKQGRVWAGHLNHGVSVYNGKTWKNYDVPHGPIGDRVFKIAVCPTDGDVWIGTSAGLTRYSVSKDTWQHYTRNTGKAEGRRQNEETNVLAESEIANGNGLPSDQVTAIAFDGKGNIYIGTECDGVAMASREADYQDWRQSLALTATGLPSRLINDLVVAANGVVYAATSGGLAWSRNGGSTWLSLRGQDYGEKIKGLASGPPPGWSPALLPKNPLPEDYVSCLAEDAAGVIWLGFRQHSLLALSNYSYREQENVLARETGGASYIRAILPMPDFHPWLASYGKGLMRATTPHRLKPQQVEKKEEPNVAMDASFPSPAKPPTLAELTALLATVTKLEAEKFIPKTWRPPTFEESIDNDWSPPYIYSTNAAYLGEDWRTLGDWTGRYGRQQGCLCSFAAPFDHNVGWSWHISVLPHIGNHFLDDDSLRYWIATERVKTDDPRCPYSPSLGYRRIGEWDDHGEAYPMSFDGPDVWIPVSLPDGVFRVSVYFCNYNGHGSGEQTRDYLLELKPYVTNAAAWDQQPTLAQCRVHDFWGGVYKSFIVTGAGKYHFKVGRNYSYNTMCNAVFVDRLVGPGYVGVDNSWLPAMEHTWYNPPIIPPADPVQETPELLKARELWVALDNAYAVKAGVAMQTQFRLAAYQTAFAANAPTNLLANWRWKMPWWTPSDRTELYDILKAAYDKRTEIINNHKSF